MRADRITREIQMLDRDLYCEKDGRGVHHIMRRGFTQDSYEMNNAVIRFILPMPRHITSLTNNWSVSGHGVDWGLEPIIKKLREIDGHNSKSIVNQLEKQMEHMDQDKKRDMKNKTEDFLYDFHGKFKSTFSDVNTSNMQKIDKRRIKDGNRKS